MKRGSSTSRYDYLQLPFELKEYIAWSHPNIFELFNLRAVDTEFRAIWEKIAKKKLADYAKDVAKFKQDVLTLLFNKSTSDSESSSFKCFELRYDADEKLYTYVSNKYESVYQKICPIIKKDIDSLTKALKDVNVDVPEDSITIVSRPGVDYFRIMIIPDVVDQLFTPDVLKEIRKFIDQSRPYLNLFSSDSPFKIETPVLKYLKTPALKSLSLVKKLL